MDNKPQSPGIFLPAAVWSDSSAEICKRDVKGLCERGKDREAICRIIQRLFSVLKQTLQSSASHRPRRVQRGHIKWKKGAAEELELLITPPLYSVL